VGQDGKATPKAITAESVYYCSEHGVNVGEKTCQEAIQIGFVEGNEYYAKGLEGPWND
jgi:hypothetical protein